MEALIAQFSEQNPTEARAIFDQVIAQIDDADHIADLELAREFFTNPEFKQNLTDYMWTRSR